MTLISASTFLEQLSYRMKSEVLIAVIALKAKLDKADGIGSVSRSGSNRKEAVEAKGKPTIAHSASHNSRRSASKAGLLEHEN